MLAAEMYEKITRLSTDIYEGIFEAKNNYYNTRNAPVFSARNMKTVIYGLQTISYTAPKFGTLYSKRWNKLLLWMNSWSKSKSGSQNIVPVSSVDFTFHR